MENCYLIEYNNLNSECLTQIYYGENLFSVIKNFHKQESNSVIVNIYKKVYSISNIEE